MRIALAQINPIVGDIDGNVARILEGIGAARQAGADLAVFPELAVFGYPPRDLLRRADLLRHNTEAIQRIATQCVDITVIVGCVQPAEGDAGKGIHNAAVTCRDGAVVGSYAKVLLPTYDVFDEARHFSPGRDVGIITVPAGGSARRVGLTICEDLWNDRQFEGRRAYGIDPVERTVAAGAEILVNVAASPFMAGKQHDRETIFAGQVRTHGVPLVSVNQVGGNDDLIFDGASFAQDATGAVVARAKAFAEDLLIIDFDARAHMRVEEYPDNIAAIRRALVLGVRDYIEKCGFCDVVIGLSGGIDSAVTAALAVEAVGADRVHGVGMPSRFSSEHSIEDARLLAANFGIDLRMMPIETAHRAMEETLRPCFGGSTPGIAEENIQARIRGSMLMALSNKFGWLLLTTGNKSELAVGYCTLYGDMCGGLAVLSDVPKTMVYELAACINGSRDTPLIPRRTIEKEPSAELRDDQRDRDSLPPYDVLDPILEQYVEQDRSIDLIAASGFDPAMVRRVAELVDRNEYKRRQAPVGLKVTSRAFGTGRRMPVAAKYR